MSEQILSQEEIDALLGAMASGDVDLETDDAEKANISLEEIEAYDLTSKNILLQNQFYALEEVNDKLTKFLKNFLSTFLQQKIDVKFVNTEMVVFDTFIQGFSPPTCFHIFTMEPLIGSSLMAIDQNLVFSLVECMFGGTGKTKSYERDFTAIEMRLMSKVATGILDAFESAWELIYSVSTDLKKSESNPEYVHLFNPNDLVMSQTFSVVGKQFSGNIYFCLSYLMLEPIKELLSSRFVREKDTDHSWDGQLKDIMNSTEVNMTAELGKKVYTIRQLINMKEGDVILLNSGPNDRIPITVESVPKYMGYPGVVNGNRAIEIVNPIYKNGGKRK
ncbi:MAG: flagellar motor switch protein FliM [Proteobacteria bacterium]|nr:flagellar motor switch protein FliM [Pseudomonadota bacterium]